MIQGPSPLTVSLQQTAVLQWSSTPLSDLRARLKKREQVTVSVLSSSGSVLIASPRCRELLACWTRLLGSLTYVLWRATWARPIRVGRHDGGAPLRLSNPLPSSATQMSQKIQLAGSLGQNRMQRKLLLSPPSSRRQRRLRCLRLRFPRRRRPRIAHPLLLLHRTCIISPSLITQNSRANGTQLISYTLLDPRKEQ